MVFDFIFTISDIFILTFLCMLSMEILLKKEGYFAKEYRRGVINRGKDEKERRDAKDFQ